MEGCERQVTQPPRPNPNSTPAEITRAEIAKAFQDGENTWIYKGFDVLATRVENFLSYMTSFDPEIARARNRQWKLQAQGAGASVPSSESRERATGNEGDRLNNSPGDTGLDVLEKLIKEKTFTKAEADRLTELIHSRMVGESTENGKEASGLSTSQKATTQELLHMVVQENGMHQCATGNEGDGLSNTPGDGKVDALERLAHGAPLVMTPSQRPRENSTICGGEQPFKRRIPPLNSDMGSVGTSSASVPFQSTQQQVDKLVPFSKEKSS